MNEKNELDIHIAEFNSLKSDQLKRITTRDNCVYLNILAVGAACAVLFESGHPASLIAIQWVSLLLGWNHLINDLKVSDIGRYIRNNLNPKIIALTGEKNPFEWEYFQTRGWIYSCKKIYQTIMDMLVFFIPSVVAGSVYFLSKNDLIADKKLPLTADSYLNIMGYASSILLILSIVYLYFLLYYSEYSKVSD